jgi:hypothetical protein
MGQDERLDVQRCMIYESVKVMRERLKNYEKKEKRKKTDERKLIDQEEVVIDLMKKMIDLMEMVRLPKKLTMMEMVLSRIILSDSRKISLSNLVK